MRSGEPPVIANDDATASIGTPHHSAADAAARAFDT